MALVLTSATRDGGPGCGHYTATLTAEPGQPGQRVVAFQLSVPEVQAPLTDEELAIFLKVAIRYYVEVKGRPLNFLVGKQVLVDAPAVWP